MRLATRDLRSLVEDRASIRICRIAMGGFSSTYAGHVDCEHMLPRAGGLKDKRDTT